MEFNNVNWLEKLTNDIFDELIPILIMRINSYINTLINCNKINREYEFFTTD